MISGRFDIKCSDERPVAGVMSELEEKFVSASCRDQQAGSLRSPD